MKSQAVKTMKWSLSLCGLALALGFAIPPAHASEWDKQTVITVNQPIQVQETLLEPGTYVFRLLDSQSDRHVVQIFNSDRSHLISQMLAIPAERRDDQLTSHTKLTFWETPDGYAKALRDWYYPGDNFGQEFRYPKHLTPVQTAESANPATATPSPSNPATESIPAAAPPVTEPQNDNNQAQTDNNMQSQSDMNQQADTDQQPATTQPAQPQDNASSTDQTPSSTTTPDQSKSLPKTGSPYPLIGLTGLFSLGIYSLIRRKQTA